MLRSLSTSHLATFLSVLTVVRNKTLEIFANRKETDYTDWQAFCRRRGGALAVIESVTEQNAANAILEEVGVNILIGPRRSKSNPMKFVSEDGRQLPYT